MHGWPRLSQIPQCVERFIKYAFVLDCCLHLLLSLVSQGVRLTTLPHVSYCLCQFRYKVKGPVHSYVNLKPSTCLHYFLALQPRTTVLLSILMSRLCTATKITTKCSIDDEFFSCVLVRGASGCISVNAIKTCGQKCPRPPWQVIRVNF